jgi:hypothetical protein
MKRFYKLLSSCLLLLSISACNNEESTSWETELLGPLAETRLSIEDIIADSLIISNPGDPLVIKYESTISLIPSDSILSIPDTTIENSYSLPIDFNLPSGFEVFDINQVIRFNYGELQLTHAILESGSLESEITSSLDDPILYGYSIPSALFSAVPFNLINQSLAAGSTANPRVEQRSFSLAGYSLDLRGPDLNSSNEIQLILDAQLNPTGDGSAVVANVPAIKFKNTFKDFRPYFAKGYLGRQTFDNSNESSDLGFMRNLEGNLNLDDAVLDLELENSIGADFSFLVEQLKGVRTSSNTQVALNHPMIGNIQHMGRALNVAQDGNPYTPVVRNFQFNAGNSNLVQMLELLPDQLQYSVKAELNPLGNISSGNDFIYSSSNARAKVAVTMPLKFAANALVFQDTISTAGLENATDSPVQNADLKFFVENGFPFDLMTEFWLLDQNKALLDTILINQNIPAAPVDADLRVISPSKHILQAKITPARLNALEKTKYIVVRVRLNTQPENTLLPIYADYFVKVQLAGRGIYTVKLK